MKAYFAGPLFTVAEREFNKSLAQAIEKKIPGLEILLPQESAEVIARLSSSADFPMEMYQCCISSIEQSDFVIAILEGADADSGTCVELGYARARGKKIIGVRSDFRASEDRGLNLMVSQVCDHLVIVPSTSASLETLASAITAILD